MQALIYDVFTSSFIILSACFIGFVLLSRWALFELKAHRAYILGWLVSLIVMVSVGAVLPDAPVEDDVVSPARTMTVFQVVVSIIGGMLVGGVHMLAAFVQRQTYVSTSLKVAGFTALGVLVNFFIIIGSPVVQRMLGLFVLTLFSFILLTQIFRRGNDTDDEVEEVHHQDNRDLYAPVNNSPNRLTKRRGRLQEIRRRRS